MNNKGYIFCPVCREVNDLSNDTCEYCGSKLKREPQMPDVVEEKVQFRRTPVNYDSPKKRQIKLGSNAIFVVIVLLSVIYVLSNKGLFNGIIKNEESYSSAMASEASSSEKGYPASVTADALISSLIDNPSAASDLYLGKYVSVTGRLLAVDSSGEFFAIVPVNDNSSGLSVICYINDSQKAEVKNLKPSQVITVTGTITEVLEDTGYYIDDNTIETQQ